MTPQTAFGKLLTTAVMALLLAVACPHPANGQTPGPPIRRSEPAPEPERQDEESEPPAPAGDEQAPPVEPERSLPDTDGQAPPPAAAERPRTVTSQDEPAPAPALEPYSTPTAPPSGTADGGLARRARLGLTFVETDRGMAVEAVAPRSPAAVAGIEVGDLVVRINATDIRSAESLAERVRTVHAGEPTTFTVLRGDESLDVQVVPDEVLREGDLESKVEYSAFRGSSGRLRSVWAVPKSSSVEARPAVLIIRGVGASAADAPGNNPYRELAQRLVRAGVIVVRYDPEGVGDSEGPSNATVDFNAEVADARAALAHVRDDYRVDNKRVFLLGHGTGGGVAAVLAASDKSVAGLVVIGMIARPLMEYLLDSRRQQMALAAVPPADVDDILHEHVSIFSAVLGDGRRPAPDEYGIVSADGTVLGKTPAYWQQYDQVNFGRLFSRMTIPVMNAIGEFDFVSTLADHQAIAEALRARGDRGQLLYQFDKADHDLRSYDSRDAAFAAFGATDAPVSDQALDAVVDWVTAHLVTSGEQGSGTGAQLSVRE